MLRIKTLALGIETSYYENIYYEGTEESLTEELAADSRLIRFTKDNDMGDGKDTILVMSGTILYLEIDGVRDVPKKAPLRKNLTRPIAITKEGEDSISSIETTEGTLMFLEDILVTALFRDIKDLPHVDRFMVLETLLDLCTAGHLALYPTGSSMNVTVTSAMQIANRVRRLLTETLANGEKEIDKLTSKKFLARRLSAIAKKEMEEED